MSRLTKVLVVLLLFTCAGVLVSQNPGKQSSGTKNLLLLNDVLGIISEYYVDEIPSEDLVMEAIEGLIESLDQHSQLLDQRRHKRLMEQTKGEFGGIGIEISIRDDTLTVLTPIPGTPASRIGLQAGDRIVRIEHEPTYGMKLDEAVKRLKGKPETLVNIWVHRIGVAEDIHFPIIRAIIKIESVQGMFMLTPEIGYVRLGVFSNKSGEELVEAIQTLKKHGMKKLIFDLRDNPGGLLSRAVDVADIFLDPGQVIVSTRGRIRSANKVFRAGNPPIWDDGPIISLISGGSASASEIVSGALQDHDKAVIMGTTSYGKGSVQTLIDLREQYALKLTTAKYYTPSGRCIHSDENAGEDHHALISIEDTLHTFTTDSGRTVHGGGGITPDLVIKHDSHYAAERKVFKQVGKFRNLMFRYAVKYRNEHPETGRDSIDSVNYIENFEDMVVEITPEMVEETHKNMLESEFELSTAEFEQIDPLIRQWMCYYIADACFDRNTAQRVLAVHDKQLLKALELLKSAPLDSNFVETLLAGRTLPDTLDIYGISR
ncbi:MAG: S41 family peptidase [Gemmatimonadota bacterium]|nr:S41 family peptidase [Gemmatimonadota bacterium]